MLRRGFLVAGAAAGALSLSTGGISAETGFMYVENNGVRLATQASGEPRRGTILLAMGATASMMWWPQSLVDALVAGGYQVIRFDNRDTGLSTTNPPGDVRYDIGDLAGDLIAILDAYGVGAAHLVGMSLGGYAAQLAALEHKQRVTTLTLISSEPLGVAYEGEGIAPGFLEHFARFSDLDWNETEAVADFMLGIAELSAGSAIPFDRDDVLARIHVELERSINIASAFNHSQIAGQLPPGLSAAGLDLPVLIVHGSEDPVIASTAAKKTNEVVRGSKLLMLDGRGHEITETDSPRIAATILELCNSAG